MSSVRKPSTIGGCPHCGEQIPAEQLVVWYAPRRSRSKTLATCEPCGDLVYTV